MSLPLQFAVEVLCYGPASMMLMSRRRPETIAATDELVTTADLAPLASAEAC